MDSEDSYSQPQLVWDRGIISSRILHPFTSFIYGPFLFLFFFRISFCGWKVSTFVLS